MSGRTTRNRVRQKKPTENGKMYIQIILCIVIISCFMMFKDTSLPNGKTPREYAERILSTTINLPEILSRFKEEAVLPAGAEIIKP